MTPDRSASQRAALVTATMASFLMPFMASALNVALPSIGQESSMDALLLSWVAMSFLLAAAMFLASAQTDFAVFAVLCVGGIFASLARGKVRQDGAG